MAPRAPPIEVLGQFFETSYAWPSVRPSIQRGFFLQTRPFFQRLGHQLTVRRLQAEHMQALEKSILRIEKAVLDCAREIPLYERLLTLPGIGRILGMTITMEVGDIQRFASDGDFASYCRLVDAQRLSNGKRKADNNQKCGNKYLSWAFVEAANFARRYGEQCRRWYDRKAAKTSKIIATKALGCKLAKAAWYVMAKQTSYDAKRMFPGLVMKEN